VKEEVRGQGGGEQATKASMNEGRKEGRKEGKK